MATTIFFEGPLVDKEDKSRVIKLEFGRSSFYDENLIYVGVGEDQVILNREDGAKFMEAMGELAIYLGYDMPVLKRP